MKEHLNLSRNVINTSMSQFTYAFVQDTNHRGNCLETRLGMCKEQRQKGALGVCGGTPVPKMICINSIHSYIVRVGKSGTFFASEHMKLSNRYGNVLCTVLYLPTQRAIQGTLVCFVHWKGTALYILYTTKATQRDTQPVLETIPMTTLNCSQL